MFSLLREFAGKSKRLHTVIVMDAEQMEAPRQYRIRPRAVLLWYGAAVLAVSVLLLILLVSTPLREIIPGYGMSEVQQEARMNTLRLASLQDSLAVQQQYMRRLQHLVTGEVDSVLIQGPGQAESPMPSDEVDARPATSTFRSPDWADHAQPALPMVRLTAHPAGTKQPETPTERYISSLKLPVLPPVNGFLTRTFDVENGHFAVDVAVEEGTVVRAIGDGYVIFADWTQDGGDAIAVQHAEGYISIYKHNQRLLKRVGDRVRDREAVSISGNSGEITTGPHLHFELWHDGLAQDPRYYVIGW